MKKCTCCGFKIKLSDFYKDSRAPDGLQGHCKMCNNIRSKKLRKAKKQACPMYGVRV